MSMYISEITENMHGEMSIKIERYLRTKIKPKPKYLPKFIWYWLIGKLLVIEYLQK